MVLIITKLVFVWINYANLLRFDLIFPRTVSDINYLFRLCSSNREISVEHINLYWLYSWIRSNITYGNDLLLGSSEFNFYVQYCFHFNFQMSNIDLTSNARHLFLTQHLFNFKQVLIFIPNFYFKCSVLYFFQTCNNYFSFQTSSNYFSFQTCSNFFLLKI